MTMFCVICAKAIPERRAAGGAVTCSPECRLAWRNRRRKISRDNFCGECGRLLPKKLRRSAPPTPDGTDGHPEADQLATANARRAREASGDSVEPLSLKQVSETAWAELATADEPAGLDGLIQLACETVDRARESEEQEKPTAAVES